MVYTYNYMFTSILYQYPTHPTILQTHFYMLFVVTHRNYFRSLLPVFFRVFLFTKIYVFHVFYVFQPDGAEAQAETHFGFLCFNVFQREAPPVGVETHKTHETRKKT